MGRLRTGTLLVVTAVCARSANLLDQVRDIVRRSVENTNADWKAAPAYDFTEKDVVKKHDRQTTKSFRVTMIDGSPYNKLIALNGEPLPAAQAAAEEEKMRQETARRKAESPSVRQKRVAQYQRERRQDHELLTEMVNGFRFKLVGEETLNGRKCFVLTAEPLPGYQPKSRETKVLTGMHGKMYVDEQQYQWVRVQAEVFRPVAFGLFIAHVEPGTQFTLEQRPIEGNLWLPSHFSMNVHARILFSARDSAEDDTYSDYRRAR